MEHHEGNQSSPVDATPGLPGATYRDTTSSVVTTSGTPAPAVPRHLYTLTVDHVAAELYHSGFHRDERTIQRWCKAGKLDAMIDHERGDRYLINPTSVSALVAAFIAERDVRSTIPAMPSRPYPADGTSARATYDTAPTQQRETASPQRDRVGTDASTSARQDAAIADDIANLKRKIDDLEREKALLSADKQVREKMVEYMQDQFSKMIDEALDRSAEVGHLRAQVYQLRAMLPSSVNTDGIVDYVPHRFTPRQVLDRQREGRGQAEDPVHRKQSQDAAWEV